MYHFEEETKRQMMDEIKYFFEEEFDLKLGILGTENIMTFFEETLGDKIYNIALEDAKRFYKRKADEMDSDYYALYKADR